MRNCETCHYGKKTDKVWECSVCSIKQEFIEPVQGCWMFCAEKDFKKTDIVS